ncbi:DegV family protein [Alkalibacter saccharofermentans]|uniref:EDD domain protein, DegV family n=1 Tax=Alkalibacter saccharofermentans DSM 14828 TaxID=1120975 RepID=A0A1M4X9A5_9FIRM|nr:DegV family protein [Alkalibacter saccharofermentans]SHE89971.1 EDD domain protein, DegV family [Alkalibacter saccharofermentans DSM 14828]
MGIRIVTDSASDLNVDIEKKFGIKVVPLTVNFGKEESYKDRYEITSDEFFEKLKSTTQNPFTSQVNPAEFEEVFNEILDQGDDIIGMFLSSELSGTFNSAVIAKESLEDKGKRIHLIDSRSVSLGLSLLVYEAALKAAEGKPAADVVEHIEAIKGKVESAIVIDTLEYLKRGGRLTAGAAFIGGMLQLKPILELKDGKLVPKDKVRGRKKALKWIKDWLGSNNYDLTDKTVYLVHASEEGYLNELKELLEGTLKPKEIIESQVGAIVGTHSGPGAIGISFINS